MGGRICVDSDFEGLSRRAREGIDEEHRLWGVGRRLPERIAWNRVQGDETQVMREG